MPTANRAARQTAMFCHLSASLGFVVRLASLLAAGRIIGHLTAYLAYVVPLASVVAPLIVWLSKRGEDPFIDEHGREAVNFQLSLLIYSGVLLAVAMTVVPATFGLGGWWGQAVRGYGLGLFIACFFGIPLGFTALGLGFPIIAAFRAYKGEPYRYPLTMRLVR